jgi:hypothetical protein
MATPIKGPALPLSKAIATAVPDGRANQTPIQRDCAVPLKIPHWISTDFYRYIEFQQIIRRAVVLFQVNIDTFCNVKEEFMG